MPVHAHSCDRRRASALELLVAAVAVLAAVSAAASGEPTCPLPSSSHGYEFHGTKTIYSDAYNYLNSKDELKGSFDDDSFADEHKDLVKDGCKPVAFFFMGRHSARFPDAEDIVEMNKSLRALQAKIAAASAAPGAACRARYEPLVKWQPKMVPEHDNLITDLGEDEERDIARRFKAILPDFFDASKTDIKIGVTSKIRTAQTAVAFLREVGGWNASEPACKLVPSNDLTERGYNLSSIHKSECYARLTAKHTMRELSFHDTCEELMGKKPKNELVAKIKDSSVVRRIADKVAAKLQLKAGEVSAQTLDSIYSTCKFENALQNDSVWCSLFDKADVKAYEYIEDAKIYLNDAYGPHALPRQACPVVANLIEAFNAALAVGAKPGDKLKAYYYFSHAGAMKKILAAFGIFEDKKSFTAAKIDEFIATLEPPSGRKFRASLTLPFSANMAFVMYRCEKAGKPEIKHKLLATVTERPVKLGGCKDTDCNLSKFFEANKQMTACDLRQICAPAA